jgi:hypothetical protein
LPTNVILNAVKDLELRIELVYKGALC